MGINKVWATATAVPTSEPDRVFFPVFPAVGGCSFTDTEHENTGGTSEGGDHDLTEIISTAIDLGIPQPIRKANGLPYPNIHFHVDTAVCMTASCNNPCPETRKLFSATGGGGLGRSVNIPFDRDAWNAGIEAAGRRDPELVYLQWLRSHGLPIDTKKRDIYSYIDSQLAIIREQNRKLRRTGKRGISVSNDKIIEQYKRDILGYGRSKRSANAFSGGVGGIGAFSFSKPAEFTSTEYNSDRQSRQFVEFNRPMSSVGGVGPEANTRRILSDGPHNFDERPLLKMSTPSSVMGLSNDVITRLATKVQSEKESYSTANLILYGLVGIAGVLMIAFIAIIMYFQRAARK